MAGTTSQPPMSALVAATENTERTTGLSLRAVARNARLRVPGP